MNKVNTKVDMRLNVALAGWISEDLKEALQRLVPPCQYPSAGLKYTQAHWQSFMALPALAQPQSSWRVGMPWP